MPFLGFVPFSRPTLLICSTLELVSAFHSTVFLGLPNPYTMVDWTRHNNRLWVVVDPLSMRHGRIVLLYLTEAAYQRMSRIALSTESDLEVVATPLDNPDTLKPLADKWDKDHPNSGPAITGTDTKPKQNTPPVRGAVSVEPMVDGWIKFYERFLNPLLKPRGHKQPKVK